MQRIVRQISCSLRSIECLWFTYAVRVSFWRHRVPLGKVERAGNLPRIIEGIKRKYGASDSNKVGDGPEPLHDYLDVSSVREWRVIGYLRKFDILELIALILPQYRPIKSLIEV